MSTITRARACKGKRKLTRDAAHRTVARLTAAGAAPGSLNAYECPSTPPTGTRDTSPATASAQEAGHDGHAPYPHARPALGAALPDATAW
jgi:hypothetical protein